MKSYFISGTDTDAGKTVVAKALLDKLKQLGQQTLAMKPVSAGCDWVPDATDGVAEGQWQNSDALILRQAMTMNCDYALTNPYAFAPPIAPHIAAAEAGRPITLAQLLTGFEQLVKMQPDALVIEGAGGWLLPLGDDLYMPDFVKRINAEVILVIGLKLGCLNHALLSARAITAAGIKLAGWVAVDTQPQAMDYRGENVAALRQHLNAPCLAELPYLINWQQQDLSELISL